MCHRLTSCIFMLQSTLYLPLRHISPHAIQFHCTVATGRGIYHLQRGHEWTLRLWVHQKCRFHSQPGNFRAGLCSNWTVTGTGTGTGLGCAVHHRLRHSLPPPRLLPPLSLTDDLQFPFLGALQWSVPIPIEMFRRLQSCFFRVFLFYSTFLICCMFPCAFYGIQWRHSNRHQCFYYLETIYPWRGHYKYVTSCICYRFELR